MRQELSFVNVRSPVRPLLAVDGGSCHKIGVINHFDLGSPKPVRIGISGGLEATPLEPL